MNTEEESKLSSLLKEFEINDIPTKENPLWLSIKKSNLVEVENDLVLADNYNQNTDKKYWQVGHFKYYNYNVLFLSNVNFVINLTNQ